MLWVKSSVMKVIVSKTADLLAKLYDLFHAPHIQENLPLYIVNFGGSSEIMYYGYVFDRFNLWDKMFDALIGKYSDAETRNYMDMLEKINIHKWDLLEAELEEFGRKLVNCYNMYRDRINKLLKKILRINELFTEEYIILSFNPLKGLIGSAPRINIEQKYIIVALFIRPDTRPEKALDLYLHELLHGLIRLNNIKIHEEIEEEFINTLCPEGYLSKEIGLSDAVNVDEGNLQAYIASYFAEKMYEKIDLIRYLQSRGNMHYI